MRTVSLILIVLCLISGIADASAVSDPPSDSAHSSILIHAETGKVLFEKNADERMLIASTTKIMTALVVLEYCSPDEFVYIEPEYTGIEGSSMYLSAGKSYTVEDLLCGMMLASGNDAATALACHAGGSIEGFAELMNAKAAELGLENSSFKNPHGLDADGHYSSARDLAVITASAMENPLFEKIVSTKAATIGDNTYYNHNKLLSSYDGAIGVKTGYTTAAGRSLVSCADRNGTRLICVTLNDGNDWRDHSALLDWGFANYTWRSILPSGEYTSLPVISGEVDSVGVATTGEMYALLTEGQEPELYVELPRFVYAPVKAGDVAGRITVKINGEEMGSAELVYTQSVEINEGIRLTPWERFKRAWFLASRYPLGNGYYGYI